MDEIWKDIEGYEGLYQVSNFGRVRSLDRYIEREGKGVVLFKGAIMKQRLNAQGYWRVALHNKHHESKGWFVHRLVALAFIDNPLELPIINHKDQNPKNNRVENLEWCNQKYNCNYADRNERLASHFEKPIKQTKNGNVVKMWKSGTEIERQTGWARRNIQRVCNREYGYKSAYGFQWEWA